MKGSSFNIYFQKFNIKLLNKFTMKKLFKYALLFAAAGTMTFGFGSCSDNNDEPGGGTNKATEEEVFLGKVLNTYVNATVNPTYKDMAAHAETLYAQMKALRDAVEHGNATESQVKAACDSWTKARAAYESSEAFLLGAANDYDVDPHIDTWPLDLTSLHKLLTSSDLSQYTTDNDDDNINNAHNNLGNNRLGFHAIEFVIFRDGQPRAVSSFNNTFDDYNDRVNFTDVKPIDELKYAVAVAGDLMYSIYELEVCWSGGTDAHKKALIDLEWKTTMPSSDKTYGWNMTNAGQAGSIYTTIKGAVSAILVGDKGCVGISDEVGQTKMGKPYALGTTPENQQSDPNYIESPFSHNSLHDFWHNIQSINNTWNGKYDIDNTSTTVAEYSFASYFKKYNPEMGTKVQNAINKAHKAIKACPEPFVKNYDKTHPEVKAAIDACQELSTVLNDANDYIQKRKK